MHTKFKKVLCVLIAVLIFASVLPVAFAESVVSGNTAGDQNVRYYYTDFEDTDSYVTDSTKLIDYDGDKAFNASAAIKPFEKNPITSGTVYIGVDISFNSMSSFLQKVVLSCNGGTKNLFGRQYTTVGYCNNFDWQANSSGIALENEESDGSPKWYHVDVFIDLNNNYVTLYRDRIPWGGFAISASNSDSLAKGITGIQFHNEGTSTITNGAWYIDNLVIASGDKFAHPQVTKVSLNADDPDNTSGNGYIDVDFTMPLNNDDARSLTSKYLSFGSSNDGVEAPGIVWIKQITSSKYRIGYSGALSAGAEYYLEYPDSLQGFFEQVMLDNKVYFCVESDVGRDSHIKSVKLIDSSGTVNTFYAPNDEIEKIEVSFDYTMSKSDAEQYISVTDEDGNSVPFTAEVSGKIATISFEDILNAETVYTLKFADSISMMGDAARSFTTGSGKFELRYVDFEDADGNKAESIDTAKKLTLKLINTLTDEDKAEKSVYLIFCAYNEKGKMIGYDISKADTSKNYPRNTIPVDSLPDGTVKIKGFVFEETGDATNGYLRTSLVEVVELTTDLDA